MKTLIPLAAIAALVALTGCPTDPDVHPTWTTDIQPILSDHCGTCHEGDATGSGGYGFVNSYADVTASLESATAQTECGDVVRAECIPVRIDSEAMPLGGPALDGADDAISTEDLELIEHWVEHGMPE